METRFRILLIASLCFVFLNSSGQQGQTYELNDIADGLIHRVFIIEDLEKEITTLATKADTLKIFDVLEIKKSVVHFNKFLEIQFRSRGGSNTAVREKVLLCISQGKIYRTLDILSDITSRVTQVYDKEADSLKLFDEKEDYQVTISIKQKASLYKVVLMESEKIESKFDPSRNNSFEKTYTLDFDPVGCFFFNSTQQLNTRYKVYSRKNHKEAEKFIGSEVPSIQLNEVCYIIINNEWCSTNRDGMSCR